tara:strand:+ start:152 stop:847 length:696 start_codon:yes stop_codon:yes gene_type:complete
MASINKQLMVVLIILLFLSSNIFPESTFYGEFFYNNNVFELIQETLLVICIVYQFKYRKIFIKEYKRFSYYARLFLLGFLFYEEISYLTWDMSDFFNSISNQDQINIHNVKLFMNDILKITIPSYQIELSFNGYDFLVITFLIILGFGSYISTLNRFKFLFLEKRYSIFSLLYLLNKIMTSILNRFYNPLLNVNFIFINYELCELFLYLLLLLDIIQKKKEIYNKKTVIFK